MAKWSLLIMLRQPSWPSIKRSRTVLIPGVKSAPRRLLRRIKNSSTQECVRLSCKAGLPTAIGFMTPSSAVIPSYPVGTISVRLMVAIIRIAIPMPTVGQVITAATETGRVVAPLVMALRAVQLAVIEVAVVRVGGPPEGGAPGGAPGN